MIRTITNIEAFEAIKEDCNRLADLIQMPLLRFEWLMNCARVLSFHEKLNVIVYYSEGRVKAIAPLVLVRKYFSERLELLGATLHNEPGGFLYEDEDSLIKLFKTINEFDKIFFLNRIKNFSAETIRLGEMFNETKKLIRTSAGIIPYLPVIDSFESFEKTISSSRRSSLKRLLKIAQSIGNLSVEITCPEIDNLVKYIDEVFEVEASGWKKRMRTAIMINKSLGQFFKGYLVEAAQLNMLRLCFLRIDGVATAVQIGIEHSNRFWILKIGYNEKFAKCSPGILLMNEVISYVFNKKLEALEFLGSNESWLHIWTKYFHRLYTYKIYNSPVPYFFDITNNYSSRLINYLRSSFAKRQTQTRYLSNA